MHALWEARGERGCKKVGGCMLRSSDMRMKVTFRIGEASGLSLLLVPDPGG